jgi:membrane associated rhomboid family serine protease
VTQYVRILLFANVGVFFLQNTMGWVTSAMIFVPRLIVIRPWTIITYMFLHAGLMHLAFNMLALFFFGPRVEERLGSRNFLTLYLVAGITGALAALITTPGAAVLGASGGVGGGRRAGA